MQYRRLGQWGLRLSEIGFGSWINFNSGNQRQADLLHQKAYESGINFFDTANVYGRGQTEVTVGRALKPFRRDTFVLATKVFWPFERDWPFPGANDRGLSRKHVTEQCHASLERLGTDYIDLYQCHRFDEQAPLVETCRAMSDLVDQGKVLYWGVSEWTAEQITRAVNLCAEHGWHGPVSNQPLYNMLERHWETEVFPACAGHGMGLVCFSPLAEGLLSGKYTSLVPPPDSRGADPKFGDWIRPKLTQANVDKVRQLGEVASDLGVPMTHLALAWCLRRREVTSVIIGASRAGQIEENVAACGLSLEVGTLERIDSILGK